MLGSTALLLTEGDMGPFFDGINDFVQIAHRAAFDMGSTFTLEAWIKPITVGVHAITDAGTSGWIFRTDGSNRQVGRANSVGDIVVGTTPIPVNQNTHVAFRYDGSRARLSQNGADVTGAVTVQTVSNTALDINIGSADQGASNFFEGIIQEVAFYPTFLSDARILAHYAAGAAVYQAGFPRLPDGTLAVSTGTVAQRGYGFGYTSSGQLAVTSSPGPPLGGFARVNDALSIAMDAAGSWDGGFLRDSNWSLCVTQTGPFTPQAGFLRDAAGRLAVQLG